MMNTESSRPPSKAVPLTTRARVAFIIGMVLCAAGIAVVLACTPGPLPDLLLGVLGIGVLICGIFAIIGRLPSGFEFAGLTFDFEVNELADLIGTVESSLASDKDARETILELIRRGADRHAYKEAQARSKSEHVDINRSMAGIPGTADREDDNSTAISKTWEDSDPLTYILDVLKASFPDSKIQERFSVPTGSRGQRPIFDFYVEEPDLAVEFERYWNRSTVDLISRKATRALEKSTPIQTVLIVTPRAGVDAFRDGIDSESVIVIAIDDLDVKTLGEQIPTPRKQSE